MTAQEKFQYWLDIAEYDLNTAEAMYETGRWLYVAFTCQQAIEKLVKGLYGVYLDFERIPRTHNIRRLINDYANKLPQKVNDEFYNLFDILTRFYINNRYPDYIETLSSTINKDYIKNMLNQTKEVFEWLLTMNSLEEK